MTRHQPDRRLLAAYALPALPLALPLVPASVLLPTFYAEQFGLSLSAVAAALFAARLLDIASDPLFGLLIDRLPTRFGRRKPWILLGGLVAAPGLWLLFAPPAGVGALWLMSCAALLLTGWTLIAVPYWAWGAELASDYTTRTRITAAREGCSLAGILLSAAVPAAMVQVGFATAAALKTIAVAALCGGLIAFVLLLARVPELQATALPQRSGLWRNRPLVRLLLIWLVNGLAGGIAGVLFPLFVTARLGGEEADRSLFLLLYIAAAVLALPLWVALAARIGKHRSWLAAMLIAILAFAAVPALGEGDGFAFALICLITGAAFGADLALPPAIQADVADYDRLRFQAQRTALIFGLSSMVIKLALALSVAIAFLVLERVGFTVSGTNPEAALQALAWTYAGLPIAAKLAAAAMLIGFPIDRRRHAVIQRRLAARTQTGAKRDDGRGASSATPGNGPASAAVCGL